MRFFIDADSFPALCRAVICRAAAKRKMEAIFIARMAPQIPKAKLFHFIKAGDDPDAADDLIVELAQEGDMVFTRDIPLAARLVELGILVLNDRGTVFTKENIGPRLSERDFMAEMRASGLAGLGGKSFGQREVLDFANAFDRELTKRLGSVKSEPGKA